MARFHHDLHPKAELLERAAIESSEELRAAAAPPVGSVTTLEPTIVLVAFSALIVWQPGG